MNTSLTGWFSLIWSHLLEHPNIEISITKCSFDNHSWNPFKILMVDNSGYMNSNCRTFYSKLVYSLAKTAQAVAITVSGFKKTSSYFGKRYTVTVTITTKSIPIKITRTTGADL